MFRLDPDPTIFWKPNPDPTIFWKPNPDPTLFQKPAPDPTKTPGSATLVKSPSFGFPERGENSLLHSFTNCTLFKLTWCRGSSIGWFISVDSVLFFWSKCKRYMNDLQRSNLTSHARNIYSKPYNKKNLPYNIVLI